MKLMEMKRISSEIVEDNIYVPRETVSLRDELSVPHKYDNYVPGCVVDGNFDCSGSNIKTLDGSPIKVNYDFDCRHTRIENLVGGPEYVGLNYKCDNTNIKSFKGIARYIGGDLKFAGCNDIKNVKDLWSVNIRGKFDANHFSGMSANLAIALALMITHRTKKNYLALIKDARIHGVEEFFK